MDYPPPTQCQLHHCIHSPPLAGSDAGSTGPSRVGVDPRIELMNVYLLACWPKINTTNAKSLFTARRLKATWRRIAIVRPFHWLARCCRPSRWGRQSSERALRVEGARVQSNRRKPGPALFRVSYLIAVVAGPAA